MAGIFPKVYNTFFFYCILVLMECFRLCLKKNLEEELGSISCFILLENLGDFVLGSEMGNISLSRWKSINSLEGVNFLCKGNEDVPHGICLFHLKYPLSFVFHLLSDCHISDIV